MGIKALIKETYRLKRLNSSETDSPMIDFFDTTADLEG